MQCSRNDAKESVKPRTGRILHEPRESEEARNAAEISEPLPYFQGNPRLFLVFRNRFRCVFWFTSYIVCDVQVQVDIFLIESDQIVNAVIELIPVLRIQMLVVGTAKSNLKYAMRFGTLVFMISKEQYTSFDKLRIAGGGEGGTQKQNRCTRMHHTIAK